MPLFFFRDKILVNVVVDPALSKILRPHQREVSIILNINKKCSL